jgi:hypothetical protein
MPAVRPRASAGWPWRGLAACIQTRAFLIVPDSATLLPWCGAEDHGPSGGPPAAVLPPGPAPRRSNPSQGPCHAAAPARDRAQAGAIPRARLPPQVLSEAARGTPNVSLTQSAPILRARQAEVQKAESKKSLLRNTQGVHMAMRLNMEQTILSQYRRLPGFHSEFMGLEIMQDNMTHVGVHDILNDPRESMEAPIAMHEGMERLLGVAPVEPFHHAISRPTLAMRPL